MALDPSPAWLPWLQALHGLSFGATHLGAVQFVAQSALPGRAATAQGLLAWTNGFAMAGAMAASGLLYARFGAAGYWAMAALAAAGGACAVIAGRTGR
jgi:PPP family 3-phenylpropionic acid transporter